MSINRSSLALAGPCLLVFLLLAGAACTQSPEVRKQRALQRGEQYLREGKANEAIVELRNALQVDPDFVPALHALGRAYATKSWYGDALRELVRAQGVAPDSLPVAADLGRALVEVGAWKDAREQAAKILEKEPRNPDGLYIRAAALMQEGKAKDAQARDDERVQADNPALLATLVAGFLSIGLARFWKRKVFDPRIHEGKIAVCAYVTPGDQARRAAGALSGAGGTDVRIEEGVL